IGPSPGSVGAAGKTTWTGRTGFPCGRVASAPGSLQLTLGEVARAGSDALEGNARRFNRPTSEVPSWDRTREPIRLGGRNPLSMVVPAVRLERPPAQPGPLSARHNPRPSKSQSEKRAQGCRQEFIEGFPPRKTLILDRRVFRV
ncbi:MAG TPA: hypothetical protein VFT74_16890, partial [Isosphaeraceae bacterium]|nr:hypothetical protein [Isosphaeraceae bacterium]